MNKLTKTLGYYGNASELAETITSKYNAMTTDQAIAIIIAATNKLLASEYAKMSCFKAEQTEQLIALSNEMATIASKPGTIAHQVNTSKDDDTNIALIKWASQAL